MHRFRVYTYPLAQKYMLTHRFVKQTLYIKEVSMCTKVLWQNVVNVEVNVQANVGALPRMDKDLYGAKQSRGKKRRRRNEKSKRVYWFRKRSTGKGRNHSHTKWHLIILLSSRSRLSTTRCTDMHMLVGLSVSQSFTLFFSFTGSFTLLLELPVLVRPMLTHMRIW